MTDTFGSEPRDRDEDSTLDETHGGSMDGPPEAPSEDEFEELPQEEETRQPPARRSALIPVAAALGGIILLGSVAWWQFADNSFSGLFPENKGPVAPLTVAEQQAAPPAGFASAPGADPLMEPAPSATPAVALSPVPAPEPAAAAVSAPVPYGSSVVAAPPESAPAPVMSAAPLAPVTLAAQADRAPVIIPAVNGADRRIEELTARIDSLQKALDQANQQLNQSIGSAGDPNGLEYRVDKLERRLEGLRRGKNNAVASPSSETSTESTVVGEEKKPAKRKIAAKPTKKTESSAEKAPKNSWVLRAAAPGEGWIAQSASSTELKKIHVGDTVPGIGKVTAIEADGDAWVVRGAKGSIQ
jgi:hypothetical protein